MKVPSYVKALKGMNIHTLSSLENDWKDYKRKKMTMKEFVAMCKDEWDFDNEQTAAIMDIFEGDGVAFAKDPIDGAKAPLGLEYTYAGTIDRCPYLVWTRYKIEFDTSY